MALLPRAGPACGSVFGFPHEPHRSRCSIKLLNSKRNGLAAEFKRQREANESLEARENGAAERAHSREEFQKVAALVRKPPGREVTPAAHETIVGWYRRTAHKRALPAAP